MTNSKDLSIKRIWIFKADVKGHYIPEKPIVINDFELKAIKDEEKGTKYLALLTVKGDYYEAEIIARKKFEKIFNALTLATGRGFEFELRDAEQISPKKQQRKIYQRFFSINHSFVDVLRSEKIEEVTEQTQKILQLLEKTDDLSEKAIDYFIIGTKLNKWSREAFLPFFKAIELISNNFSSEFKERLRERIPDLTPKEIDQLATARRKILNACDMLGVENVEKVEIVVKARNKFDIAHATSKKKFKKEYTDACRQLAVELIVSYLIWKKERLENK